MTSSSITENGGARIKLLGAPDKDIGISKPTTKAPPAVRITLAQDTIRALQKHTQSSKGTIQLLLGMAPQLRYGSNSTTLQITPSTFRSELYENENNEKDNWNFRALITHSAVIAQAKAVAENVDVAVAQLQATMKNWRKEKEENKATLIEGVEDPSKMSKSKSGSGRKSAAFLRKNGLLQNNNNVSHSLPSSPALNASTLNTPALLGTPLLSTTTATSKDTDIAATRYALIHLLAVEPRTVNTVAQLTKIHPNKCAPLLSKIARQNFANSTWALDDRSYKEVDPWKFNYPAQPERQKAIDNAVRAFDRQRLSREDKVWQLLLKKEDRGKGICLSKLNLHAGPVGRSTPIPNHDVVNGHLSDASSPPPSNHRALLAGAGGEAMGRTKNLDSMAWKTQPASDHANNGAKARPKRIVSSSTTKIPASKPTKKDEGKSKVAGDKEVKTSAVKIHKKSNVKDADQSHGNNSSNHTGAVSDADDSDAGPISTGRNVAKSTNTTAVKSKQDNVNGQKRKADARIKSSEVVAESSEEDNDEFQEDIAKGEGEINARKKLKASHQKTSPVSSKASKLPSSKGSHPPNHESLTPTSLKQSNNSSRNATSGSLVDGKNNVKEVGLLTGKGHAKPQVKKIPTTVARAHEEKVQDNYTKSSHNSGRSSESILKQESLQAGLAFKEPLSHAKEAAVTVTTTTVQVHNREPSTASSSHTSPSDKSTPMHRQSSSQSSISVRPSELPKSKKRPANISADHPKPAKRARAGTLASSATSPHATSSPLSDIASISTPSEAASASRVDLDSSLAEEISNSVRSSTVVDPPATATAELLNTSVIDSSTQTTGTSGELSELERLRGEYCSEFLSMVQLRIEMDKALPSITSEQRARYSTIEEKVVEIKRAIKQRCITAAEDEFYMSVPKDFKLDEASENYLVLKLKKLSNDYDRLLDELEAQENKPAEKVQLAWKMKKEVLQLKKILIPAER